jgi:hypothetical protein
MPVNNKLPLERFAEELTYRESRIRLQAISEYKKLK